MVERFTYCMMLFCTSIGRSDSLRVDFDDGAGAAIISGTRYDMNEEGGATVEKLQQAILTTRPSV